MWRHLNGRITVAYVTLLAYIFDGLVQINTLPVSLTNCDMGLLTINVSDMNEKGYVLVSYGSDIELSFHSSNKCPSNYLSINNSAFEIVLNRSLTTYCNPYLDCLLNCKKRSTASLSLRAQISRNASYQMEFQQTTYNASVRELTSETTIKQSFKDQLIMRQCQDGSLLSSPTFNIATSTKEGWFTTKGIVTDGIIYSTSKVDYEQLNGTNNVILTIRAEQTLENGVKLTANTTLIVTIEDVDDMNPVFTEDVYHLNISETKLGLDGNPYRTSPPIYAYDGDRGLNETILYSIKDDMKSKFSINNMSGEISVLQELDADGGQDRYVVIIQATQEDNPFRSATSTLSLSVIDINDNLPELVPTNYNCSINEHSSVGQFICKVSATDKDKGENANFTYHFRDTNNTVVDIDPNSGVITVHDSQMLDREKESIISVQVITKTMNGLTDNSTATVTINLIDINDNSPDFNSSFFEFYVRNKSIGDYIGKIDAFDLDEGVNKILTYDIIMCLSNTGFCSLDNCRFPFQIDHQFGNISLNETSVQCKYSALVSVCDSSPYSKRCSTTQLIIHVESNMTNTVTQIGTVPENAANNSLVAQIPAQCLGTSIVCDNGDKENVFMVDKKSNMVVTNGYLDYENTSSYNCSIVKRASDNTAMCTVIYNITVLDVNDNAPTFTKDPYFFEIPNNGSGLIGQVYAEDKDEDNKQAVTFHIQESSEIDLFRLNSTSGALEARDVKALSRDYYHLSILASDSGKPPLKSLVTVLLSKFFRKGNQLPLRTKFSKEEIDSNKANFERNISVILKVTVTIEKSELESMEELQRNKIYISAISNGSALSFEELLRLVLRQYDPLMSYLLGNRGESEFTRGDNADSGMTAPVIALITIACVVFVGTFISIIVIRKQYKGHQRYKRLYQNLTSHSSLYESQELKVRMEDETSDYNGSVNSQDLEISDQSKPGALTSTLNPMYGLDSTASTSVAEAMLSLTELSDRLNKEENVPTPDYENAPSVIVEQNVSKSDYENVPLPLEVQDQTGMGELVSTEAHLTSSGLDNVEIVRSESPTPDYDQRDDSNEMVNTASEPNGINSEQDSETAANSLNIDSEKNNENVQAEPLPDYNKKQVRFAHQVLDPDENKMTPLKHDDETKDGDTKETGDDTSENKIGENASKYAVPPLDLSSEDADEPRLNISDESGWLEEEINSPVDVMTVDDKDNEFFEEEITSL